MRNADRHPVYRILQSVPIVFKTSLGYIYAFLVIIVSATIATVLLFIINRINLVYTLQTYAHILQRIHERHQLFYRLSKLTDNILHCKHHTESHITVYYRRGCHYRYHYVLHLVYEYAASLLRLLQTQTFYLYTKQFRLHIFPLPTATLLTTLQFYLLHRSHKFIGLVAILCLTLKHVIIYLLATLQKRSKPQTIKHSTNTEYYKNQHVVPKQHDAEHNKCYHREHDSKCLLRKKRVNTPVIAHTLQNVSHLFGIKERHRKTHQFNKKIANKRYVYTHIDMQQQPTSYEIDHRTTER